MKMIRTFLYDGFSNLLVNNVVCMSQRRERGFINTKLFAPGDMARYE